MSLPAKKKEFTEEIIEKAKPSTLELLRKHKARIDEEKASRENVPVKNRGEVSL